jgi:hypothetical protein
MRSASEVQQLGIRTHLPVQLFPDKDVLPRSFVHRYKETCLRGKKMGLCQREVTYYCEPRPQLSCCLRQRHPLCPSFSMLRASHVNTPLSSRYYCLSTAYTYHCRTFVGMDTSRYFQYLLLVLWIAAVQLAVVLFGLGKAAGWVPKAYCSQDLTGLYS